MSDPESKLEKLSKASRVNVAPIFTPRRRRANQAERSEPTGFAEHESKSGKGVIHGQQQEHAAHEIENTAEKKPARSGLTGHYITVGLPEWQGLGARDKGKHKKKKKNKRPQRKSKTSVISYIGDFKKHWLLDSAIIVSLVVLGGLIYAVVTDKPVNPTTTASTAVPAIDDESQAADNEALLSKEVDFTELNIPVE